MKLSTLVALGALSLSACAQTAPSPAAKADAAPATKPAAATVTGKAPAAAPGTPAAIAIAALHRTNPRIDIDSISNAPMAGFQEVIVNGQPVYVSNDGKYLLQGRLYDTVAQKDLSEASISAMRKQLIAQLPVADRIVFAPANPKHTVLVFTDIECGYCRKLHSDIAEYNKQGIAIEYLAFPRAGIGSQDYKQMVSVWCAPDRRKALTDAKNDRPVPERSCKNPVDMQYHAGNRMGLTGTPMIINMDGVQVSGYLPPEALRQRLDQLAAKAQAAPGA